MILFLTIEKYLWSTANTMLNFLFSNPQNNSPDESVIFLGGYTATLNVWDNVITEYIILDGFNHNLPLECPEQICSLIINHLKLKIS